MMAVKRSAAVSRAETMAVGEAEIGVPPKTTQSAMVESRGKRRVRLLDDASRGEWIPRGSVAFMF